MLSVLSQPEWWANWHKSNCVDLLKYITKYLDGDYPEFLLKARIKDYEREYIETKSE